MAAGRAVVIERVDDQDPFGSIEKLAKLYAASIPHITGSPAYTAVELKILQQFTCLGLGWSHSGERR
jgi:hypothetical protein